MTPNNTGVFFLLIYPLRASGSVVAVPFPRPITRAELLCSNGLPFAFSHPFLAFSLLA
jgi:hypothetical protein